MLPAPLRLRPIDVRLCGAVPRRDIVLVEDEDKDNRGGQEAAAAPALRGAPCSLQECLASGLGASSPLSHFATPANGPTLAAAAAARGHHHGNGICEDPLAGPPPVTAATMGLLPPSDAAALERPLGPVVEPPAWAVPATGEARLEPVCEATGRQAPVDLTRRACFRIGRSPNADVQLFHATSSRRHAMVFHHANGACYVVDCGSAHGTYLNGRPLAGPSAAGVAVPHRVRRGALLRFGGPGAPCFILKAFAFGLEEVREAPALAPAGVDAAATEAELLRRNTRLNALGESAARAVRSHLSVCLETAMAVVAQRKRSFDSLDSRGTVDVVPPDGTAKRARCESPELPAGSSSSSPPPRLVSPDLPAAAQARRRRVTFCPAPPRVVDDVATAADEAP